MIENRRHYGELIVKLDQFSKLSLNDNIKIVRWFSCLEFCNLCQAFHKQASIYFELYRQTNLKCYYSEPILRIQVIGRTTSKKQLIATMHIEVSQPGASSWTANTARLEDILLHCTVLLTVNRNRIQRCQSPWFSDNLGKNTHLHPWNRDVSHRDLVTTLERTPTYIRGIVMSVTVI